jgi:GT2 family glycosyltransferase
MNIAYVCTNYNSSADTIRAVSSLEANIGHNAHTIIVDNQSDTAQQSLLQNFFRDRGNVDVVFNPDNSGYFAGLNVGLRRLRETRPDLSCAIVGNNDLIFPVNFIDTLQLRLGLLDHYPVVSPNITTLDGEYQNPHVIDGISPLREHLYDFYHSHYQLGRLIKWAANKSRSILRRGDEDQHEIAQEIWQGHGSCYIFGPLFFAQFAELWAPTFLFGEEFFLAEQLKAKGYSVFYESSISLVHACHSSVAQLPSRRHWELARDAHLIYRKHNPIGRNARRGAL